MNNRFITIISNIALVSVALSSGTTIPSSTLAGGNTLISKKSTNNPSSDVISSTTSVIATTQVKSPPSTTTIIQNTTVANPTTTISNSPSVENQTSPHNNIDSNTTKKPSSTTTTVVSTQTNNSTQQPAGPETTVRPIPSSTTTTPVPDTTTEDTKETTVPCDCSKYLSTSTDSANKNTEFTTPMTSSPTTVAPQTTAAPLISSATNTPPNTTTNTTTGNPTTTITMTKHITTKNTTTTSTTTNSKIVATTAPTTLRPTTMVSTLTPIHLPVANITKPTTTKPVTITPKPATPKPVTPKPTTPKTATPKPATPKQATQKLATQKPATPKPATQKPATQKLATQKPATPKPATPTSSKSTAPIAPTTQPTTTTTTTTTTATLIKSTTGKTNSKVHRRDVAAEIKMFQSEVESIVDDDTNTHDIYCMNQCKITMNETTTEPTPTTTTERPTTTTPKPTTTTPRHRSINLNGKLVDLNLVIVVKGNFTHDLKNHSSEDYTNLANQYNTSLTEFYRRLIPTKVRKIVILGFLNGSIKCNFSLEMNAPINESDANSTLQILRNVNWKNASITNLDVNKTVREQTVCLANDTVFLPANVCVNNEVLEWDNDGNPICKYQCDTPGYKDKCGDHGECSFTYGGAFRCICKDGFSGELCRTPKPTTTTAKPIKPDAIALSKIDIIGIAAGIGGGLVLILLVALCCVYTKLNKAKKRDRFYGYMDNDKEFLHDENSRIENVPDLKNEYTNLGYQTEQDELQMQRFEPEGKNVDYEPGQRQGAYERDDKAYRKVEEPEGGNVMIYQPKHLNGPIERQSGASKFDEVEERSTPYRMMDTDTTYKIRRPTVNSDRNVPYN